MEVLICDDDKTVVLQVKQYLNLISQNRLVPFNIFSFLSGDEVINSNKKFDIAFIDIEMPGVNGLEVTKHIKQSNPNCIIFIITAYQKYLDDAMSLNVFRYISKPIDSQRFIRNMNKAIEFYDQNTHRIIVDNENKYHNIFTCDILYATIANKSNVYIFTNEQQYISNKSWEYWINELKKYDCFVRSHYSYIVNINNIVNFDKVSLILQTIHNKTICLPVSRRYFQTFKKKVYAYIGETV